MAHTETPQEQITASQETVLNALMTGTTATEAARLSGVHRSTVHRWLKDPRFLAEFNGRRAEMQSALAERLAQLQAKALDAVESALEGGDTRIAIAVLRGCGTLNGIPRVVGPDDPQRVSRQMAARERDQSLQDLIMGGHP